MTTPNTTEQHNATRESAYDMSSSEVQARLTPLTPSTSPLVPTAPLIPRASAAKPSAPSTPINDPAIASSAVRGYGWSWSLRVLGIALALAGGAVVGYVLRVPTLNSDIRLWLFALGLVVWAALVAGLVQSFWAVLLVPGRSIIGLFMGNSMYLYGSDVLAWFISGLAKIDSAVVLIIVPWLFGAFIGTPFGVWIEQRLRSLRPVTR